MARATLILIDVPLSKVEAVRQRILLCVKQTGDELIGYRGYGDQFVQFVVKLQHNDYIPKHQIVLGPALQAGAISAFTFTTCHLIKLVFNHLHEVQRLQTFPLRERELWFPALNEPSEAYVGLTSNQLNKQQSEWIVSTARAVQQEQETEGLPSDLL